MQRLTARTPRTLKFILGGSFLAIAVESGLFPAGAGGFGGAGAGSAGAAAAG